MRPAFRRPMVSLVRIGHTIKEGTMHETNNGLSRRSFLKGTAAGIMGAGALGMGAFSLVGCSGGEGGDLTRGRCKTHTLHSSPEQHELRVPFSPSKYLATRTVMIHHVLLTLASLFTFR